MQISDIFRWVLAIALGLFGWLMISVNLRVVHVWLVRREHHSMIPPLGGLFALAGMAFCPLLQIRRLAWIPVAIDLTFFFSVMTIGLLMQLYAWRSKRKKHDA